MAKMKTVFLIFTILILPVLTAFAIDANYQANPGHHPKLVVTPANLNFFTCSLEGQPAPVPAQQTLQIRGVPNPRLHNGDEDRARKDSLTWTAVPSAAWIHIEPSSGFTPDEAVVSVDPAGLAVGEYAGTIEFNTSDQAKPRLVQIKLRIQTASGAALTLEPASVSFQGVANSNITLIDSVHLGVVGADQIEYTASNSQSWLKVVPSQATAPFTVLLLASTDSLPDGFYYDTVVFRSGISNDSEGDAHCLLNATNIRLPVTLTLFRAVQIGLVVSPERLGFAAVFGGSNPQPQNLMISSLGDRNLGWTARKMESWLHVVLDTGTATPDPQPVQISIDIAGLNPGLYSDTIMFHMGNFPPELGNKKIPVFLQIFPPSELSDSVAIGDGVVDLTDPQINRFSVPIFASNTQAVRAIALPLHFQDGQTNLDSVVFAGGRAEFADLKLFLRLSEPGDFLILLGFVLAPAL
ncbi:MAG: BACON domain-containing protein, partial [Candidatus Zixiibacteriota bacterium]